MEIKIGDKVRRISNGLSNSPVGFEAIVTEVNANGRIWYRDNDGYSVHGAPENWELVPPSIPSPIKTETITRIGPGVYGRVIVGLSGANGMTEGFKNWVSLKFDATDWNADELRSAAATMTEIANHLESQKP